MGDGIGHVCVTGVALGLLTGTSPTLTAVVVAIVGRAADRADPVHRQGDRRRRPGPAVLRRHRRRPVAGLARRQRDVRAAAVPLRLDHHDLAVGRRGQRGAGGGRAGHLVRAAATAVLGGQRRGLRPDDRAVGALLQRADLGARRRDGQRRDAHRRPAAGQRADDHPGGDRPAVLPRRSGPPCSARWRPGTLAAIAGVTSRRSPTCPRRDDRAASPWPASRSPARSAGRPATPARPGAVPVQDAAGGREHDTVEEPHRHVHGPGCGTRQSSTATTSTTSTTDTGTHRTEAL